MLMGEMIVPTPMAVIKLVVYHEQATDESREGDCEWILLKARMLENILIG